MKEQTENNKVIESSPVHSHTNCRDEDGITVGLIDSIISIARILKDRDLSGEAVRQALMDLKCDKDIMQLIDNHWIVSYVETPADEQIIFVHGFRRVFADDKEDAIGEFEYHHRKENPNSMPIKSIHVIKF